MLGKKIAELLFFVYCVSNFFYPAYIAPAATTVPIIMRTPETIVASSIDIFSPPKFEQFKSYYYLPNRTQS